MYLSCSVQKSVARIEFSQSRKNLASLDDKTTKKEEKTMAYPNTKIYFDGSHYIGIPHEEHPERSRKNTTIADDKKQAFEAAYEENKTKKKAEKTESIVESIKEHFEDEQQAREYVEQNTERKLRNLIAKWQRLWRKVNLQKWDFFATFTYDDKKHDEVSFRRSLSNCLKHLSSRKGWKYIGVWERSPEKNRLHFHCLLFIPKKHYGR